MGALAQNDRRAAYAALTLGATTVAEVAERTGLRPPVAAAALQKLVDVNIAFFDSEKHTYTLLDDTFRLAVRRRSKSPGEPAGTERAPTSGSVG